MIPNDNFFVLNLRRFHVLTSNHALDTQLEISGQLNLFEWNGDIRGFNLVVLRKLRMIVTECCIAPLLTRYVYNNQPTIKAVLRCDNKTRHGWNGALGHDHESASLQM